MSEETPKAPEGRVYEYAEIIKKLDSAQEGDIVKISTGPGKGFFGKVLVKLHNGMVIEAAFPDNVKGLQIEIIYKGAGNVPQGGMAYEIRKPGEKLTDDMKVVQPMGPSKKLESVSVIPRKREKPLLDL